jgi:hypothetical protein
MRGRNSRFQIPWLAALVALAAHSCCALDKPRSFLRIDKAERRDAILAAPAIEADSTRVTLNGVQNSKDATDRLRQLVEKATNKTAAEEDTLLDEIVPQIVDCSVGRIRFGGDSDCLGSGWNTRWSIGTNRVDYGPCGG